MTCTILVSKMPFGKKRKLCCKRKVLLKESKNHQQANYYWVGEGPQHVTLLQLSIRYTWLNSLCLSVSGDLFKNRDSLEVPKIIVFEEHVRSKLQLSSRARCRRRGVGEETDNMRLVVTSPRCVRHHQARQPVVVGQRSAGWEGL